MHRPTKSTAVFCSPARISQSWESRKIWWVFNMKYTAPRSLLHDAIIWDERFQYSTRPGTITGKEGIFVSKASMVEQVAFGHGLTDLFIRQSSQLFGTVCSTSATTRITRNWWPLMYSVDINCIFVLHFYITLKNVSVSHTEPGSRYYKVQFTFFFK